MTLKVKIIHRGQSGLWEKKTTLGGHTAGLRKRLDLCDLLGCISSK
jgi:hypothetical protein